MGNYFLGNVAESILDITTSKKYFIQYRKSSDESHKSASITLYLRQARPAGTDAFPVNLCFRPHGPFNAKFS